MQLTPVDRALAESFAGPEPFEPAPVAAPLRAFRVQVKSGPQVRLSFEAMATSKTAAQQQYEGLCEPGEQVVVYTPHEWEVLRFRPARLSAMQLQLRQQDVADVIGRRS